MVVCLPSPTTVLRLPRALAQKLDFSAGVKRGGLLKYEIKGGVLQNLTPP